MVKIKKGLSDEDMLRGFQEKISFENGIYAEEKSKTLKSTVRKPSSGEGVLLPKEELERLNRFLLEIGMECVRKNLGSCTWKVSRQNEQIIIKPVLLTKK